LKNKLLILDGLSELNLGRDIYRAALTLQANVDYFDLGKLEINRFYFLIKLYFYLRQLFGSKRKFRNTSKYKYKINSLKKQILDQATHILVIRYAFKFIEPKILKDISQLVGAKLFLYDSDSFNLTPDNTEFVYFINNELPIYNQIFSFSKVATDLFNNSCGLNATFFPYGCNASKVSDLASYDVEVLFVGRASVRRIIALESIADIVTVYGDRYNKYKSLTSDKLSANINNRTIWGKELIGMLQRSKIVLNVTNSNFYAYETGLSLRIFEALSAGCFLLTEHNDEIASLFKVGKELETYTSIQDLKCKVKYYLNNEIERLAIAKAGHAKFLEKYTWDERVKEFASLIKLSD